MGLLVVHGVPLGVVLARLPGAQREATREGRLKHGIGNRRHRDVAVLVHQGEAVASMGAEPHRGKRRHRRLRRGCGLGVDSPLGLGIGRLGLGGWLLDRRGRGLRRGFRCREGIRHGDAHRRQRHHRRRGYARYERPALLLGRRRSLGRAGSRNTLARRAAGGRRSLRCCGAPEGSTALRAELGAIRHLVAAFGTEHGHPLTPSPGGK